MSGEPATEVVTDATRLNGLHAVVTGAGRGIGAAIALELGRRGACVSILGRHLVRVEQEVERVHCTAGGDVSGFTCDVTDEESVTEAFAGARNRFGSIAILVNNAGQAESAALQDTSLDLWEQLIAVNLTGAFLCCREAIRDMLEHGDGRIVNVASTSALKGYARLTAYTAAKHGLLGLTRSLAAEVARSGTTVNAVCPGYTDTGMAAAAVDNLVTAGRNAEEAKALIAKSNPRGTLIEPEEIATVVAWLCSPAARSVSGQAIVVAGGDVR